MNYSDYTDLRSRSLERKKRFSARVDLTKDPESTKFAAREAIVVERFQPDITFLIEKCAFLFIFENSFFEAFRHGGEKWNLFQRLIQNADEADRRCS